jgi:hypothetical protein
MIEYNIIQDLSHFSSPGLKQKMAACSLIWRKEMLRNITPE